METVGRLEPAHGRRELVLDRPSVEPDKQAALELDKQAAERRRLGVNCIPSCSCSPARHGGFRGSKKRCSRRRRRRHNFVPFCERLFHLVKNGKIN